jgi:hypothetical protein
VKAKLTSLSNFFPIRGDIVGLGITTCYGASRINAPIHNITTYPHNLFVMVLFMITLPRKILKQVALWRICPPPPPPRVMNEYLLVVLKPNRLIRKRTDANCSSFQLRVFLGLSNPQGQRQTSILSIPRDNLRKQK